MVSTTTRLLIRWARGWISVGGPGREQCIEIAGVQSYEEAKKLGEELLEAHKGQRGTVSVTGHVHNGAQQPGDGFYLLDRLDGMRVESVAVGRDGEGYTTVTPELGDPRTLRLEQMERRLKRASAGSTSEWASPVPPRQTQGEKIDSTPPKFTYEFPESSGGSS